MEYNLITEKIKSLNSREEVGEYLKSLKLKKNELFAVGKLVHANISQKDNKDRIINQIVNATIGNRLKCEAIAAIDLSR